MGRSKTFTNPVPKASLASLAGRRIASESAEEYHHVPVEKVKPNPHQPRTLFGEAEIEHLAASLRESGFLQPLLGRLESDGTYTLVSGHRRLAAAIKSGLAHVPLVARNIPDEMLLAYALAENLQRKELHPVDQAKGFEALVSQCGTQEKAAEMVGIPRPTLARYLTVLGLSGEALTICAGIPDLPLQALFDLLKLPAESQVEAAQKLAKNKDDRPSVRPAPKPGTKAKPFSIKIKTSSNTSFKVTIKTRKKEATPQEVIESLRLAADKLEADLKSGK